MKPASLRLLARLPRSRKGSLLVFSVALGALLLAAVWFTTARNALDESFGLIGGRQQELAFAEQRLQETELRVRLAESAKALVRDANASAFVEERWGERLINVAQAPLARQDVNNLLASVSRDSTRIFGAQAFELSVTRPDEGLFDTIDPRSPPLMMTMRGTLLFRTEETP